MTTWRQKLNCSFELAYHAKNKNKNPSPLSVSQHLPLDNSACRLQLYMYVYVSVLILTVEWEGLAVRQHSVLHCMPSVLLAPSAAHCCRPAGPWGPWPGPSGMSAGQHASSPSGWGLGWVSARSERAWWGRGVRACLGLTCQLGVGEPTSGSGSCSSDEMGWVRAACEQERDDGLQTGRVLAVYHLLECSTLLVETKELACFSTVTTCTSAGCRHSSKKSPTKRKKITHWKRAKVTWLYIAAGKYRACSGVHSENCQLSVSSGNKWAGCTYY